MIDGREYLYFGGTSYHCLHADAQARDAGIDAWRRYGTNTATSRRNLGTSPVHWQLEREAADFFGTEDSAYLASGYLVNSAAVHALSAIERTDCIYIDECSHFSLWHAAHASRLPVHGFDHRDPSALVATMRDTLGARQRALILSDGVFPGTGAIAPVAAYAEIAEGNGSTVWIDDSHGIGVLGAGGRGTLAQMAIDSDHAYFGGTLGKAFGGFGGLVPAEGAFLDGIHAGPTMIGASPAPTPIAAATLYGLRLLRARPELCDTLRANALYLKEQLLALGMELDLTPTPIVTFAIGDTALMQRIQASLAQRRIAIQYADDRYPGIGDQGALRIVVFSAHTRDHLDELLEALASEIHSARQAPE
jgi:7-keto-8-aminopelargonate synthetase-like enzyme